MSGFSFLEVLVALLILSLGLLGIMGMQLTALRHTHQSYFHSVATVQLVSILERLRANYSSMGKDKELQRWNTLNEILLPQGKGTYHCQKNACAAQLQWWSHGLQSLSLNFF